MPRFAGAILLALGVTAGAAGGYWYARLAAGVPVSSVASESTAAAAERKILYYRDPSGAPYWSAEAQEDAQGRNYLPVYEDEEISFEPQAKTSSAASGGPAQDFVLPQSHGPARHFAGPEEGLDGDGLHPGLWGRGPGRRQGRQGEPQKVQCAAMVTSKSWRAWAREKRSSPPRRS
jgi:hypothetical protein